MLLTDRQTPAAALNPDLRDGAQQGLVLEVAPDNVRAVHIHDDVRLVFLVSPPANRLTISSVPTAAALASSDCMHTPCSRLFDILKKAQGKWAAQAVTERLNPTAQVADCAGRALTLQQAAQQGPLYPPATAGAQMLLQ